MKKLLFLLLCAFPALSFAQSFDEDRVAFSNFIERMYNNAPFEGCRLVDDYDHSYFLSVVALDKKKYTSSIAMNRVSQVKSQRNAGEFFNGTQSYSEFVIKTPNCQNHEKETGQESGVVETFEVIKTSSTGFVQQLQLLTTFDDSEGNKVYIYYKQIKE